MEHLREGRWMVRLWLTPQAQVRGHQAEGPHGRGCGKPAVVKPHGLMDPVVSGKLWYHPAVVFLSSHPVTRACRFLFPVPLSSGSDPHQLKVVARIPFCIFSLLLSFLP